MALYVAEINIGHNFWTLRDSVFIFGIYTQLKKSFQKKNQKKKPKKPPKTSMSITLTVSFDLHF